MKIRPYTHFSLLYFILSNYKYLQALWDESVKNLQSDRRTDGRQANFVNVFSLFCNYLPLDKGMALHLNKLESPLLKNTLCQVWLKLSQYGSGEEDEQVKSS